MPDFKNGWKRISTTAGLVLAEAGILEKGD
jgi:hypothetical protein